MMWWVELYYSGVFIILLCLAKLVVLFSTARRRVFLQVLIEVITRVALLAATICDR